MYITCVRPAEQGALRVISQAIRQAQIVFNQHPPVGSVHVGGLNLGGLAVPIGPVKITVRTGVSYVSNSTNLCTGRF